MKANGLIEFVMVKENRSGRMVRDIRETEKVTVQMEKESLHMLMVTSILVNGKMIKLMAKAFTYMLIKQNMMENGGMTNNMDQDMKPGQMAQSIMVFMKMEESTEKAT